MTQFASLTRFDCRHPARSLRATLIAAKPPGAENDLASTRVILPHIGTRLALDPLDDRWGGFRGAGPLSRARAGYPSLRTLCARSQFGRSVLLLRPLLRRPTRTPPQDAEAERLMSYNDERWGPENPYARQPGPTCSCRDRSASRIDVVSFASPRGCRSSFPRRARHSIVDSSSPPNRHVANYWREPGSNSASNDHAHPTPAVRRFVADSIETRR